ncbi:hypothetical protein F5148DRAFT_1280362 [Russula earlei]|uniref:Uncharacterized protein n=1 Tax=Russula earlei TaxID=71964 RepID=A0ACC0UJB8_9AGAM|nr:hypothetical protein F5148DRAFT_1280362 [Russula earlei]
MEEWRLSAQHIRPSSPYSEGLNTPIAPIIIMDNTIGARIDAPQVKFFPPLHEQRRSWALEILRRERVTTVLDVGCGEGIFLHHLTHAPPWRAHTSATPAPAAFETPDFIHVSQLHGLDITKSDLLHAVDVNRTPETRSPNPAFEGIECIVATEVVEHLPEDVLNTFAPILLGNYAPRLLLMTTPTFDFNERFRAPGEEAWGFPDPTGRTGRIFRHEDHKFEWTVAECVEWCKAAAHEWGYEVVVDGVGQSITKDPWGRDSDAVRASQAVTFRRREGEEWSTTRAVKYAEWASRRTDDPRPHESLATHVYKAHPSAQNPAPREEIAAMVKTTIQDIGSSDVTIFELWREDSISTLCSGWLELLLDVLDQDKSFVVQKEGKNADDWKVQLPGVELHGRNPWQRPASVDIDAWGESSETTDETETYEDDEESYQEEYDGAYWDETEESGWAVSDSEWSKENDESTLKAWGECPSPEWIGESTWD